MAYVAKTLGKIGTAAFAMSAFNHPEAPQQRAEFARQIEPYHSPYAQGVKTANALFSALRVPLGKAAGQHMMAAIQSVEERRTSSTSAAMISETIGFGHSFVDSARQADVRGMSSALFGVIASPVRGTAVYLAASQHPGTPEYESRKYR